MKQEIKKLVVLLLLMNLFTSSQEKTSIDNLKVCKASVAVNTCNKAEEEAATAESDVILMPISRIIIMQ